MKAMYLAALIGDTVEIEYEGVRLRRKIYHIDIWDHCEPYYWVRINDCVVYSLDGHEAVMEALIAAATPPDSEAFKGHAIYAVLFNKGHQHEGEYILFKAPNAQYIYKHMEDEYDSQDYTLYNEREWQHLLESNGTPILERLVDEVVVLC